MTYLDKIIDYKRDEVIAAKAMKPLHDIIASATAQNETNPTRGFAKNLRAKATDKYGLIAEVKKASPSKGLIRADFDPTNIAKAYEAGGAACLSVLTDAPSFQGSPAFLDQARNACTLPVLRKDFMIDPYQIIESRAMGADCILLIMACLSNDQAKELEAVSFEYNLDVLIETHDQNEMDRALTHLKSPLIGVNNRNLKTFETSLQTSVDLYHQYQSQLAGVADDKIFISESGIGGADDIKMLSQNGINCFLIGESLMRHDDVEAATRTLLRD